MIYLGADHRGYHLKEKIKRWLEEWGCEYQDLGNTRYDPEDDYPSFATRVAKKIQNQKSKRKDFGVLICGTGMGMTIVANRFSGVRCGLGFSADQVKRGRGEDDINCLALPADFVNDQEAKKIVKAFLKTRFLRKAKYQRRIGEIEDLT